MLVPTTTRYTPMSNPMAVVLTAIVISFGMTAFAMVLAFRTRQVCDSNDINELAGGEE